MVKDYQRGEGEPEVKISTPKLSGKKIGESKDKGHGGFVSFIGYADGQTKEVIFKGSTYLSALPTAIGYADRQIRRITLRKMEPWTTEVKS